MKIRTVIDNYLRELSSIRRYSNHTLRNYSNDLSKFYDFCTNHSKNNIEEINEKFIKSFLVSLNEDDLDKVSITRALSTLRGLFKYSFQKDFIKENPSAYIKNPKLTRRLPEIVSTDKILEIYNLVEEENEEQSKLIKAIFELLYGCSLRVSELCSLKISDYDEKKKTLRVFGKGSKTRIVPVGSKSVYIINQYLENNTAGKISDPLLRTQKGNRIYPEFVYRVVNKYLTKVTELKKKSPHILRHSSATHMLDRGADLRAVKEILGHENLSTTQIYTQVSIERLKSTYKKSHPKS